MTSAFTLWTAMRALAAACGSKTRSRLYTFGATLLALATVTGGAATEPLGSSCAERLKLLQITNPRAAPVPLHAEPDPLSRVIDVLPPGRARLKLDRCLTVAGYRRRWCRVVDNGSWGWVNSFYLEPVPEAPPPCTRQSDPDRVIVEKTTTGKKREISNWEEQALEHLRFEDSTGVRSALDPQLLFGPVGWRCPRLNNYWCIKSRKLPWTGEVGKDDDGHAAFATAVDGAAAAARLLQEYVTSRGRKTLVDIVCSYAPDDDCIGSTGGIDSSGRCTTGRNSCRDYATAIAQSLAVCVDCRLNLFDERGRARPLLTKLMTEISAVEISRPGWGGSVRPSERLVSDGIARSGIAPAH